MGMMLRKAGENWVPLSFLVTIVSATWVIRGGIEAARADWNSTVAELRRTIDQRTARRWDVEMAAVSWEYFKNTGEAPDVRAIKAAVEASRQ